MLAKMGVFTLAGARTSQYSACSLAFEKISSIKTILLDVSVAPTDLIELCDKILASEPERHHDSGRCYHSDCRHDDDVVLCERAQAEWIEELFYEC